MMQNSVFNHRPEYFIFLLFKIAKLGEVFVIERFIGM